MKRIVFGTQHAFLYQYLMEAMLSPLYRFANQGEQYQHIQAMSALRAVGVEQNGVYTLLPSGGEVVVDDAGLALMQAMVTATPPQPSMNERAFPIHALLASATLYVAPKPALVKGSDGKGSVIDETI